MSRAGEKIENGKERGKGSILDKVNSIEHNKQAY